MVTGLQIGETLRKALAVPFTFPPSWWEVKRAKIVQAVAEHPDWTLDQLGKLCGVHRLTVYRVVRKLKGLSPYRYRQTVRRPA